MTQPVPAETEQFIIAGLYALRCIDLSDNRRRYFGPDADANWQQFAGLLRTGDRIRIMLSDAAIVWREGFSLAAASGQLALASDGLTPPHAQQLLHSRGDAIWAQALQRPLSETTHIWRNLCSIWNFPNMPSADLPPIDARSLLIASNLASLSALAEIFRLRSDLDWFSQVRFLNPPDASFLWRQQCALASWYAKASRIPAFIEPSAIPRLLAEHTNAQVLGNLHTHP